jgi:hypothetical protein
LLIGSSGRTLGQSKYFGKWPAGTSPQEVGKRIAENFVIRKFDFDTNPRRRYVIYPEICAEYGSLTVAQLTKDQNLTRRLVEKFAVFLTPEGAKRVSPDPHVDFRVFGVVAFEIYMQPVIKSIWNWARSSQIGNGRNLRTME